MDLREIGWDGMDWVDVAQDRDQWRALLNTVLNLLGSIKSWEVLAWLHNWRLFTKGSAPWVSESVYCGASSIHLWKTPNPILSPHLRPVYYGKGGWGTSNSYYISPLPTNLLCLQNAITKFWGSHCSSTLYYGGKCFYRFLHILSYRLPPIKHFLISPTPSCSEIIINNTINTQNVKQKQYNKINNYIHATLKIYTVFYCDHYSYILKSVNQISLNIHSTSQTSYPNNEVVNQLLTPNNRT
jgi:hypothetical protein